MNKQRAAEDGLGWWTDYVCRLVKTYPSFTRRYVKKQLAMVEGWQWYAFAVIDDQMNKFGGIKPTGGYVAQESENLIKQAHESWQHQS